MSMTEAGRTIASTGQIHTRGPSKSNGQPPAPLPAHQQEAVEQSARNIGLAYHTVCTERDELKAELGRMVHELTSARAMLANLESQITSEHSRTMTYQLERDQAVAQRAAYEALFRAIQVQLHAFVPPAPELIDAIHDAVGEFEQR